MASSSSSSFHSSMTLRCLSAPRTDRPSVAHLRASILLPRQPSRRSIVAFSRRRKNSNSAIISSKKKKQIMPHYDITEDDVDGDALQALFSQLEEDLKNDDPSLDDGNDEISEEDLAKLEIELEEALGDDELLRAFGALADVEDKLADNDDEDDYNDDDDVVAEEEEEEEEEEEKEEPVKLKNWQLRRLAYALKDGRRKISIKNLAGDVCLDRAIVLQLLRDPPPNLLLMSAALPDKPISTIPEPESETQHTVSSETIAEVDQPEAEVKLPVHVMQSNWSARKRLKKVQVETLERVYARTKRPTNAIISSIVHVTNLPRKKVVKWFEDRRAEEGVPEHRLPYQRSASETVFNS